MHIRTQPPMERLYNMREVAARLTISRSRAYELVASRQLSSIKIGRLRRVTEGAIAAFIEDSRDV